MARPLCGFSYQRITASRGLRNIRVRIGVRTIKEHDGVVKENGCIIETLSATSNAVYIRVWSSGWFCDISVRKRHRLDWIKTRESTVVLFRALIICSSCLDFFSEIAQMHIFHRYSYFYIPLLNSLVPRDSFKSASATT